MMNKSAQCMIVKPKFKDEYNGEIKIPHMSVKIKVNQGQRWYALFVPGLDYWIVANRHGVELTLNPATFERIFEGV